MIQIKLFWKLVRVINEYFLMINSVKYKFPQLLPGFVPSIDCYPFELQSPIQD